MCRPGNLSPAREFVPGRYRFARRSVVNGYNGYIFAFCIRSRTTAIRGRPKRFQPAYIVKNHELVV